MFTDPVTPPPETVSVALSSVMLLQGLGAARDIFSSRMRKKGGCELPNKA